MNAVKFFVAYFFFFFRGFFFSDGFFAMKKFNTAPSYR